MNLKDIVPFSDLARSYGNMMELFRKRAITHPAEEGYRERLAQWSPNYIKSNFRGFVAELHNATKRSDNGYKEFGFFALIDPDRNKVIGESFIRTYLNNESTLTLSTISYLSPDERGKGLGNIMAGLVFEKAVTMKADCMAISVSEENPASWKRFEKLVEQGLAMKFTGRDALDNTSYRIYEIPMDTDVALIKSVLEKRAPIGLPTTPVQSTTHRSMELPCLDGPG